VERRMFLKGIIAGSAATLAPVTLTVPRVSAGRPPVRIDRREVRVYRRLTTLVHAYATPLHAVEVHDRPAVVRHLYRGLLQRRPSASAVDARLLTWHHDGPARLLLGFMRQSEFVHAQPAGFLDIPRNPLVSEPHLRVALTRIAQTQRLWTTLFETQPSGLDLADALLSVAHLAPSSSHKTIILPAQYRSSSVVQWQRAHAEMDSSSEVAMMATPFGAIPSNLASQFMGNLNNAGIPSVQHYAVMVGLLAAIVGINADLAASLQAITLTMADGAVSVVSGLFNGVASVTLAGIGLAVLGFVKLTVVMGTVTGATASTGGGAASDSPTAPPNGPAQTPSPIGVVDVGQISIVDVGPVGGTAGTADAGESDSGEGSGASGPGGDGAW
jgi:hypothetical protein